MISSVWIDLAVLDDARQELRHVVPDVELAEVVRHPAPALHVDEDALDRQHLALSGFGWPLRSVMPGVLLDVELIRAHLLLSAGSSTSSLLPSEPRSFKSSWRSLSNCSCFGCSARR